MVKGQLEKCQKKVGATDEQIDNLLDGKDTNSDIAKCLAACALEQYTIVRIHVFAMIQTFIHKNSFSATRSTSKATTHVKSIQKMLKHWPK